MGEAAPDLNGALHREWRPSVNRWPRINRSRFIGFESARQRRKRAAAYKQYMIRMARRDVNAFTEYTQRDAYTGEPFRQQWFHERWHHHMDVDPRVLIMSPRNTGKTAQIISRILFDLGRDRNRRIKYYCATDGRAKERLQEIQRNIRANPRVREVFPELEPDPYLPWNAHKIYLRRDNIGKDASVEAGGITSSQTGGRAEDVYLDDVVDQRNALTFPAMRKQIRQIWFSDIAQILEPRGRVRAICTPWHKEDLNHALMASALYRTVMFAIDERFGAMWPEKWPEERLRFKHQELGSVEFNRAFRCIAVDIESQMVNPAWFRYVRLLEDDEFNRRVDQMFFIVSYDTASTPTGRKEQDYSASVVLAVDPPARKIYIIDAWHGRHSLKAMARYVYEEFKKYAPFRLLIEKVGQASLDEWVVDAYPETEPFIKVFRPQQNKASRLLASTPLLEDGTIIFSHHLDPNQPQWDPQRGSLIHELEDFGFTAHDDIVDAFSQAVWFARWQFLDRAGDPRDNELDLRVDAHDGAGSPYIFY